MTDQFEYIGDELSLFKHAHNWKNYFGGRLKPFLVGDVLEVGAGIGATTQHLFNPDCNTWTCLEPDAAMCADLNSVIEKNKILRQCKVICGIMETIPAQQQFDAIIYIDVLEHIETHQKELAEAFKHLKLGGKLVILSPAYMYLFSDFDKAIGHFRRYTSKNLRDIFPPGMKVIEEKYLDGIGVLTSLANKWFLKQKYPTVSQIKFWDKYIIPVSRVTDRLVGFSFGRSVLVVAEKMS